MLGILQELTLHSVHHASEGLHGAVVGLQKPECMS
jgi:hypothetical protein